MMRRRIGRPGLMGTMARTAVVAGTATAVAGGVKGSQQAKANAAQQQMDAQNAAMESQAAMAQMQAQMATMQAQQAPAPAAVTGDLVGEIERLASLHASGILNDQEFDAAKAALLT